MATLTAFLEQLLARIDLSEADAAALMRALTDENLPPAMVGGAARGTAGQGRDRGGGARLCRGHARPGPPLRAAAGPGRGRHRRHGRRRFGQPEPVHGLSAGRGGLRPADHQARQSLRLVEVGQRRRAGGSRRDVAGRRGGGARPARCHEFHLPVRTELSPGNESHRAGAPRARRAHGLQYPGSAHQSGRAAVLADRGLRSRHRETHGRHAGRYADGALLRRARRARLG